MTEGILGQKGYVLPAPHVLERSREAKVLAKRYALAYKRAEKIDRLHSMYAQLIHIWQIINWFLMPLTYAVAEVLFSIATAFELARRGVALSTKHLKWYFTEALLIKLKKIHIKDHKRLNTALASGTCIVVFFFASCYSVGLEVILDGESIGYISSQRVFEKAVSNVSEKASEVLGSPYVLSVNAKYQFSIVRRNVIFNSNQVEQQLFGQISEVKNMYVLTVDGEVIGANEDYNVIKNAMNAVLGKYEKTGKTDRVDFVQDVQINYQLAPSSVSHDEDYFNKTLSSTVREAVHHNVKPNDTFESISSQYGISETTLRELNPNTQKLAANNNLLISHALPYMSVAYTENVSYDEIESYKTEYVDDETMFVGETKVLVPGIHTTYRVFAELSYVDDAFVGKNVISKVVTNDAVTEIVARGTLERKSTGKFKRPYNGMLSSNYGNRYIFGRVSFHSGIDLAGPIGDIINASDGGIVVFAGVQNGYGNVVVIDHQNGFKSAYAHCSKFLVTVGQEVGQGEAIAKVGNTGRSTGPHLHFEIRENNSAVNPNKYLVN